MNSKDSIIESLHNVQKELKAPKGQFNAFGKYKYRSCEDILAAVKEVLPEGHVITLNDDIHVIGDRVYVKATASFSSKDDIVQVSAFAREPLHKKGMDESQVTGTASSYARKYALNGLLLIDDTKDADSMDNRKEGVKPKAPTEVMEKAMHYLLKMGMIDDSALDDISYSEAAKILGMHTEFLKENKSSWNE